MTTADELREAFCPHSRFRIYVVAPDAFRGLYSAPDGQAFLAAASGMFTPIRRRVAVPNVCVGCVR